MTFRLRSWSGHDDGRVTWDPSRQTLSGSGQGAELLRSVMGKARRAGELDTPAGPIQVADPFADLGGLADCVLQHWELPAELMPHMVHREAPAEVETDLPVIY
ncbi:MAG: hypothetical protein RIB84_22530 [Sneathiellaceae bacterium]